MPTDTKDELLKLVGRVLALTGPDRGVDAEVHIGRGYRLELPTGPSYNPDIRRWFRPDGLSCGGWLEGSREYPPHYTASLDAALTLVPERWAIDALKEGEAGSWYVNLRPRDWVSEWTYSKAATPALALTVAALRALARKDHPHANERARELLDVEVAKQPDEIDLLADDVPPLVTEAAAIRALAKALANPLSLPANEKLFDLLEGVADKWREQGDLRGDSLRAAFARGTGGADIPFLIDTICALAQPKGKSHD